MANVANSMYYGRNTTVEDKQIYVVDAKRQAANDVLDPLLLIIRKYYAAMEEFNSLPEDDDNDAAEYTWLPWWNLIKNWDRPILTAEGAIAAIDLANEQIRENSYSEIVEPLLKAVRKYLINKH
ncbi:hypothetical protein H3S83_11005 [Bartonella sp. W8122]|uniref:hypothetical protein n=1 Tax=Bartonella sp. W8122 TaxID=2750930 RepID=UPI0018DDD23E|nr:hypothetical protein [Bartonella sp. W8122]MBI0002351.1 hypothetical protein [Bartonella sp. W8122]